MSHSTDADHPTNPAPTGATPDVLAFARGVRIGLWDYFFEPSRVVSSPELCAMLGRVPGGLPSDGAGWFGLIHAADHAAVKTGVGPVLAGARPTFQIEARVRHADGAYRWFLAGATGERDDAGRLICLRGTAVDIMPAKETEEALRQNEQLLQRIVEQAPLFLVLLDAQARYRFCFGSGLPKSLGIRTELMIGKTADEFHEGRFPHVGAMHRRALAGAEVAELHPCTNRWLQSRFTPLRDTAGTVTGIVGITVDITEQVRAKEELQAAREQLAALLAVSPVVLYTCRPDGDFACTFVSDNVRALTGYEPREFLDEPRFWIDRVHSDDLPPLLEKLQRLPAEEFQTNDYRFRCKDGSYRWTHDQFRLVRGPDGAPREIVGAWLDVDERKQAEDALRESTRFTESVARAVPDILYVYDLVEQRSVYGNRQVADFLGYSAAEMQAMGSDLLPRLIHPDDLPAVRRHHERCAAAADGEILESESRMRHASGDWRWLRGRETPFRRGADGRVSQIVGAARDVTALKWAEEERQRLDEKLCQTQKLESLGVLAGGVAHEFNNLLTGVLGHANLALLEVPARGPARDMLERIAQAGTRAAELCRQMLAYSGRGRFLLETIDLSALIRGMGPLLKAPLSKKATLLMQLADDLPPVEADAGQMHQVTINLVLNAGEALGDRPGVVTVRTGRQTCDRAALRQTYLDEDLPEGEYVFLEVADDGPGMDRATQARIFEPFFSTKFTGRGLGLAAVLGIVRGHRGAIAVESAPGRGAAFRVLLPRAPVGVSAAAPPVAAAAGGAVLLVDDEDLIRDLGRRVLERAGYSVLLAADGVQALEIYRARPGAIQLVVLDLTMPRLGGEETLRELRQLDPAARVILSSGYAADEARNRFNGAAGFLQKPYRPSDLLASVRSVLGHR